MKCSLDRFGNILKIFSFGVLLLGAFHVECVPTCEAKHGSDILMDFDFLVSQLYLQQCTFVEIGEGLCSLFVELAMDNNNKKLSRKQMFFGNCLCSEFHKWHLCSYQLTRLRPEDCEFQEGTSCPSTSARVHRRLCDVTGMSQWNGQCNCSITVAGVKQEHMCGFRTCYASPMPKSICGPRTVCGTAHCDIGEHGSLYSVRCDHKCRYHQPFCEDPFPGTSLRRAVTSQWAEWRPVSPSDTDSKCSMQQFETECLDDKKDPAFDCLGPGLFCCGKEESDCTCEVKMQDGKLKAFRYMIKFADIADKCDNNISKLKVRSAVGLKGDAKVWNRFMSDASKEDKKDSISMFGKPSEQEAYYRKFRPGKVAPGIVKVQLQNEGKPKEGILQHLAMLMSNHSQGVKSNERFNVSSNGTIQAKSLQGERGNRTMQLVNVHSQKIQQNQTVASVKSGPLHNKEHFNSNVNQLQILSNSSISNLTTDLQNVQKNAQHIDKLSSEKSLYHFKPLSNITVTTEIPQKNNSNGEIITERVRNISNEINIKAIIGSKNTEQSEINKNVNINNVDIQPKNISMENQMNHQKESDRKMNDKHREISNNSTINPGESSMVVLPIIQNNLLDKGMITILKNSSTNENTKNKVDNLIQPLEVNAQSERNTSEPRNKESDSNEEKLETINNNDNHQILVTEKEDIKVDSKIKEINSDSSRNNEGRMLEASNRGNKIESEGKENSSFIERPNEDNIIGEEKAPHVKGNTATKNSQEYDSINETEINADISKENKSHGNEKTKNLASKQEFLLGGILSENKGKGQEHSSVDEEDKVELDENQQGYNSQENNKVQLSVTSKLINQDVSAVLTAATTLSTKGKIRTERVITCLPTETLISRGSPLTTMAPTASLSLTKLPNISYVSNNIKLTTVGLKHNEGNQSNGKNKDRKVVEQKSQKSVMNVTANVTNITQKNITSSGALSGPNMGKSTGIKKQALDKKANNNEIANILPNYTPFGMPSISPKRRPRPHFLAEDEEKGITLNIKTKTTPDLLGALAKKLFKSHPNEILNNQHDPFRMLLDSNPLISLPEEKPVHDYDEPEPVLKDLNKVDRESVDEKMAEALSRVADLKDLPGKVEWSEKSVDETNKLDFEKVKLEDKENVNSSERMPITKVRDKKEKKD